MTILFRSLFFACTLLVVASSALSAQSESNNIGMSTSMVTDLSLSPAGCFIDDNNQLCKVKIEVHWRKDQWSPFCLFVEGEVHPFYCSDDGNEQSATLLKTTAHSFSIVWRKQKDQMVVDTVDFIVTTDQSSRRHRRRHPWSIF